MAQHPRGQRVRAGRAARQLPGGGLRRARAWARFSGGGGAPPGGPRGIYRSDDRGASWLRINDDVHQHGGPGNGQLVLGDANVYGRVYMSTAGRGIVYGQLD